MVRKNSALVGGRETPLLIEVGTDDMSKILELNLKPSEAVEGALDSTGNSPLQSFLLIRDSKLAQEVKILLNL